MADGGILGFCEIIHGHLELLALIAAILVSEKNDAGVACKSCFHEVKCDCESFRLADVIDADDPERRGEPALDEMRRAGVSGAIQNFERCAF